MSNAFDTVACRKCGTVYPVDIAPLMFRRNSGVRRIRDTRSICIPCEQTRGDARKRLRRSIRKAHSTIGHHAKRFGLTKREFERRYGWTADRIAHDIEHAHDNTCCYCQQPYADMAHGLADVTIDIIDPAKEPFYSTNTRPCCMTCNRAKSDMSPEDWAKRLLGWRLWREHQTSGPTQIGFDFASV
jgi:hypothetical protein